MGVTINRQSANLGSYCEDTRHCCRLGRGPPSFALWVHEQRLSTSRANCLDYGAVHLRATKPDARRELHKHPGTLRSSTTAYNVTSQLQRIGVLRRLHCRTGRRSCAYTAGRGRLSIRARPRQRRRCLRIGRTAELDLRRAHAHNVLIVHLAEYTVTVDLGRRRTPEPSAEPPTNPSAAGTPKNPQDLSLALMSRITCDQKSSIRQGPPNG